MCVYICICVRLGRVCMLCVQACIRVSVIHVCVCVCVCVCVLRVRTCSVCSSNPK